jgi:cyclophilin family peptidyl-prolyl cis-trans isomerase
MVKPLESIIALALPDTFTCDTCFEGFYNDVAFFRTVPNFMVQFGIPGNPRLASKWQSEFYEQEVNLYSPNSLIRCEHPRRQSN